MKKLLVLLTFLLTQQMLAQNVFFVLQVKGIVKNKKSGAVLKTNDQVSDKDMLTFSSTQDAVLVISTKSGRMILRPVAKDTKSELAFMVSSIIKPASGRLSTRRGMVTNTLQLTKLIQDDSLAVIDAYKIWVAPAAYEMSDKNFFFLRYTYGGQTINKKLSFVKDTLVLNPDEIFMVDGKPVSNSDCSNLQFYYRQGNNSTMLANFTIRMIRSSELKESFLIWKKIMTEKNLPEKELVEEAKSMMRDLYGNPDDENVRQFLKSLK